MVLTEVGLDVPHPARRGKRQMFREVGSKLIRPTEGSVAQICTRCAHICTSKNLDGASDEHAPRRPAVYCGASRSRERAR